MIAMAGHPVSEPAISVGLAEKVEKVSVRLLDDFADSSGRVVPPGEYRVGCRGGKLECPSLDLGSGEWVLEPGNMRRARFSLEATIGVDFHWQQTEEQVFTGTLRIVPQGDLLTIINDVLLETYITSVICSEMRSASPPELAKAHAIISRSWLLAQLRQRTKNEATGEPGRDGNEIIRWTDRESHAGFDVCADDHCQRYQGVGRIGSENVTKAIDATRGMVLTFGGQACDARFSKCCGGVSEHFGTAWADVAVPYLVPVFDGPGSALPDPPLDHEPALRDFLSHPPEVYCNCEDDRILSQVLNDYDLETRDFFRWQTRLDAERAGELIGKKLGLTLGRVVAMEPVERGLSGRLKRLRLVGEDGSVVVGKELEIRRALSDSHLYSSAFVIDTEGPAGRPDAFLLSGAGWGHGVGLCQIGAAVMAFGGTGYRDILGHYYPGTSVERLYD